MFIILVNPAQLGSVDLNLLVVLHLLLETRNASKTAERLGRTPSAVSHALRRIRQVFDDPMFVRVGIGLEPTPHALALTPALKQVLQEIGGILSADRTFDPARAARTYRAGAVDYHELVVLPELARRLAEGAPGIAVETTNPGDDVERQVQAGALDLAFSVSPRPLPGLLQRTLFREEFCVLMRKDHPLARGRLTLRRFAAARHAVVSPRGRPGGRMDDALAEHGLQRQVVLRTAHFVTAPLVVAQTDLLLTIPKRVAHVLAGPHNLAMAKPPIDLPGFAVVLIYAETMAEDPAHRWLREQIVASC